MTETVTLALSELRALVTKAARGSGLSWGLAEEAGWAAEWLARQGLPAAEWATEWMAARLRGGVCVIELGAHLADLAATGEPCAGRALPDGLVAPGYFLPFLHRLCHAAAPLALRSRLGLVALVAGDGTVTFGPGWQAQSDGWHLAPLDPPVSPRPRPQISPSVLDCLEGLALRTTVPPSHASRQDAGSAGGDND